MSTYVMSDIHGQYDVFERMLKHIKFSDEDTLYIVGDIFDRGPKNMQMIKRVMNTPNIHLLMGNHEQMALDYFTYYDSFDRRIWFDNGGKKTFTEIKESENFHFNDLRDFCKTLEYRAEVVVGNIKYIMAHADPFSGIREDMVWHRIKIFDDFSDYIEMDRADDDSDTSDLERIYITGHTPLPSIFGKKPDRKIYKSKDKHVWFIDYGCAYASVNYDNCNEMAVLGCIRLEDQKLFYLSCVDKRYK